MGYAVADHLRTTLIIETLTAALVTRKPPKGIIFPSDHGCQYTPKESADSCTINGVRRSMGRRATCYNNAGSEPFFTTYKKNLSTPDRGTTPPTSDNKYSCGPKATTTVISDTPPSVTGHPSNTS
jgi:transposase InsO family protein